MDRREFLKVFGAGSVVTAAALTGCDKIKEDFAEEHDSGETALGPIDGSKMTYRTSTSGDTVSLLGFGMMRLPTIYGGSARNGDDPINQKRLNEMVDYAMAHGVNYYDTAPVYCKGKSEAAVGEALSHHDRSKFFVATKLSNFNPATWSREESIKMYRNSFKNLRVDYIDYYLLHSVGGEKEDMDSMTMLKSRYFDNGVLDFLIEERKAGRIRNLGFSFHGDIKVFDYMLSLHETIHWDFVQIQMNYIDWRHAEDLKEGNVNAETLYGKLEALGIPVVIMEPLLGGQLATLNENLNKELQSRRPQQSIASWAFRFAGTYGKVLTVLSGMTYMEHLQDNLRTYCPLEPCSDDELQLLEHIAQIYLTYPLVPCTACRYCMPCPYGLDIPGIFSHYNKMINTGNVAMAGDENYRQARRRFLIGYDRAVPGIRQADHCIGCRECVGHCPQKIDIPYQMTVIDKYVEQLKIEN